MVKEFYYQIKGKNYNSKVDNIFFNGYSNWDI